MPDPGDFLPQPPWEGPPTPEGFVKAFRLTPEQVKLIQEINDRIRKRTTYGLRAEIIERWPASKIVWSNSYADWYREFSYTVKGAVFLDAKEILVYGTASDIDAILSYLEPLPLYVYSEEARRRGFGIPPPPWTKHWTWPKLPVRPVARDGPPRVELICPICGKRFEEHRPGEDK